MISKYLFLLLELLYAIAKSCQINWRIEKTKTDGSIFFAKIELLIGNFAITEVNELKNIYITVFKFTF